MKYYLNKRNPPEKNDNVIISNYVIAIRIIILIMLLFIILWALGWIRR